MAPTDANDLGGFPALGDDGTTEPVSLSAVRALAGTRVSFLIYHREGTQTVDLVEGRSVVIGRSIPADVIVADSSLSREHLRVTYRDGDVHVEDLGSTNGTWLNGQRLSAGCRVQHGDELRVGTVTLVLHALGPSGERPVVLEGHERFMDRLADEIVRAKTFQHSVSVLMLQARRHAHAHVSHWAPRVQRLLRPVDRAALYGPGALVVCIPQPAPGEDDRLARTIVEGHGSQDASLVCGIASYPHVGTSAYELLDAARAACRTADARRPVCRAEGDDARGSAVPLQDVVAASAPMRELLGAAQRVANATVPVLIYGETGAGKEVLARVIHEASHRRKQPLRFVNCGAIPDSLVESLLFGYERGAFTGADRQTRGMFEEANGGSLMLDEIAELPLQAQAALLRVIETMRITRVGGSEEIPVDVRVLAATHRDLEAMCRQGTFRQDLLFRLDALTLHVPALRDRVEDIEALAERFLQAAAKVANTSVRGIDPDCLALLRSYSWPGNVRELRNVIDRAVVFARGALIRADDLPERLRRGRRTHPTGAVAMMPEIGEADQAGGDIREQLRRYEAQLIVGALRAHGWNQTKAAQALGMSRRSLVEKIRVYGLRKEAGGA